MSKLKSDKLVFTLIFLTSFSIIFYLIWLIYFNETQTHSFEFINQLPFINACINTLTTILLVRGFILIKKGNITGHIRYMLSATAFSVLFLVGYVTYHHFHGDTKFIATGLIRTIYFSLLISHIVLSIAMVPMILMTLYRAFTKDWDKHRKIAKKTFPVWLYVSITGVIIYIFLAYLNR